MLHRRISVAVAAAWLSVSAFAVEAESVEGPYIVVDVATGSVLDDRDAVRPWYPASTTKLMTAYVTFRALKAGEITAKSPVTISKNALAEPPSKMGFKVGTVLTVDNALKMIMVKSANDIAVALGEAVAGTERRFIERMNEEAERLGMRQSIFANPHGLPDSRQVTSARDMAVLARALLREFPEYSGYFDISAIRHGKRVLRNYNTLIDRYPGATGMKTGYICASGFNLVASAKRGNREVVAVVFGSPSAIQRGETTAALLDLGFSKRSGRKTLANVNSGSRYKAAFDMRPHICTAKARTARANERKASAAKKGKPEFREMADGRIIVSNVGGKRKTRLGKATPKPPVRVFTGGATANIRPAPLPRHKPAGAPSAVAAAAADSSDAMALDGAAPVVASAFVASKKSKHEANADGPALAIVHDRRLPRPRPN